MAMFRNRNGKWQARIQVKTTAALSKTLINRADSKKQAQPDQIKMQMAVINVKTKNLKQSIPRMK